MEEDCDALFEHLAGGYWKFRKGHSKYFELQGIKGDFSGWGHSVLDDKGPLLASRRCQ